MMVRNRFMTMMMVLCLMMRYNYTLGLHCFSYACREVTTYNFYGFAIIVWVYLDSIMYTILIWQSKIIFLYFAKYEN